MRKNRVQRYQADQLASHIIIRVVTFTRKLQLQSCRVHALRAQPCRRLDLPGTIQDTAAATSSTVLRVPKKQFRINSKLRKSGVFTKKKKHAVTSSSCQSPVWVLFLKPAWAEGREIIPVHTGERWQQALQMELSCLAGAGGGGSLGSGVAGLAARRCTGLEHGQLWGAKELGFRARSPSRCTTGWKREANTLLALPRRTRNSARRWAAARPPLGLNVAVF